MTIDTFVEAEILATCNALGTEINGVYEKGHECIECLRDILRYLKRDSENYCILRYLGSLRLLQTDLLPIIKRFSKDKEIFEYTLRILVALTNPAPLLYNEDLPDDKISRNIYLQIISFLQSYKKAFADLEVWKVLYEYLKEYLKITPLARSESEKLMIERIIILTRNILHVPADESILKQTDEDLSPHDRILWSINDSKMSVLLLYMAANEYEHQYCMHILEIVSLIMREHTAETLALTSETRSNLEKQKDLEALLAAREREQKLKSQKIQSLCASRFKGVYCVKNMKSLSENDYIAHKLIADVNDIKFDLNKSARRKPKNRVRAPDVNITRQSTLDMRIILRNFCKEFLRTYNKLMVSVKRELVRKVSNEHDDSYYLWAMCYFMQFNRLYNFQPALVSETISTQTFHHIQTEINNYQEMMLTDKKKALFWAKRMQLGVSAYKEMLETLKMMERSEDKIIRNSADALVGHVFYVVEYRELLLSLLSSYDEVKFPLSYLAELVESVQIFLKMLEHHSKKHSGIIVQQKQRKVHRRKKKKVAAVKEPVNEEYKLNEQWDAIASELSAALFGRRLIPDITPFDGASDMTFEEQKIEAVFKIRDALIANKPCEALGLLRAARELWPEGNSFGTADIEPEPEFLILREIHFSNLQKNSQENQEVEGEEKDSYEEEEDEEAEAMASVAEKQLDLNDMYKKYASPKVVQPCSLLLANYQNNKPQTNACLIKLLHRIAWDCKMHALFFQSTIFLTFQKIFHEPDVDRNPVLKEFYRFAKFIMRNFFAVAEKNKKVFVEFLFWKGAREAYELEEGYGTHENKSKLWTEDEDEELKYLYDENKNICIDGQDVADIILANFNGRNKTKTQIVGALKRLGLIKSARDLKPEKRTDWTEEEVMELQNLYEDYKNSEDVMSAILEKLTVKRKRKIVVDKLLELNLIQDRKDVRKKSKNRKKSKHSDSEENSSDEDDEAVDEPYNNEIDIGDRNNANSESSDDENEREFFKNLEAERFAEDSMANEKSNNEDDAGLMNSHSKKKKISSHEIEKNKRPPKVWEEQEAMELTALFHENSTSSDILGAILKTLTIKRPKHAVIDKLLELGLIKDKKELKKKRISKEKINKFMNVTKSDSDDNFTDVDSSINDSSQNVIKRNKKSHCRILDSSDEEDKPLSHSYTLNNSKITENLENSVKPPKKKREEKPWEEQEIIELNNLFIQYKDSDDVLDSIVKGLTKKRTQKSVIEKMLETGLVKDKKELKKKKKTSALEAPQKKKQSEVWEEKEIVELSHLFQEGKNSNDIMTHILSGLTIKRAKQDIIEKLLELHLIEDKKEVRKKRDKSAKKNKKPVGDSDNSDDDHHMISKRKKKYVADSSDDEIPLGHISLNVPNKKTDDQSYDTVSSENFQQKDSFSVDSDNEINKISDTQSFFKTLDDDQKLEDHDSSFKVPKRKRLVMSDNSSDDETRIEISASNEDYLLGQKASSLNPSDNSLKENIFPKVQKKKLRILDDSDDSD